MPFYLVKRSEDYEIITRTRLQNTDGERVQLLLVTDSVSHAISDNLITIFPSYRPNRKDSIILDFGVFSSMDLRELWETGCDEISVKFGLGRDSNVSIARQYISDTYEIVSIEWFLE